MSRPQEPQRPIFSFGNPFKTLFPKGSNLPPKLIAVLKTFEENLAERLWKLKPRSLEDVLSLSWMRFAVESLSETHSDIQHLIAELELPVNYWEDKWIDVYLDNSLKLLDICIAFTSELSRLGQGSLILRCALHNLDSNLGTKLVRASSLLDSWSNHINAKNPRIEKCFTILDSLIQTLDLPKIKNSSKGKVLMRALYGVKVETVFICSVFAAAFSGSGKNLFNLQVPKTYLWGEAFTDLQVYVNGEIRNVHASGSDRVVKELEAVESVVKKLCPMIRDGVESTEDNSRKDTFAELEKRSDQLSSGIDSLTKQLDGFFKLVMGGRDTLLSSLRVDGTVPAPVQKSNLEKKAVRL